MPTRYLFPTLSLSSAPVPLDLTVPVPSCRWTTVAGTASIITALRFAAAPRAPRLCIYADLSCALPRVYTVFPMYVHMLKT